MFPYWILLVIPALAALAEKTHKTNLRSGSRSLGFMAYYILLVLAIGFRYEVGADWFHYFEAIERSLHHSWMEGILDGGDPAYGLLTWISGQLTGSVYLVNLVSASTFALGLIAFAHNGPRPWLTIAVAVPYLVIVVAMGYTRQGVAIGLAMVGLIALDKGQLRKFIVWIFSAALFHKTALILIPLAIFAGKNKRLSTVGVLLTGALLFKLMLAEYVDNLVAGYITDEYASSGAGIRIAMNVLPALIFLIFRKRFGMTQIQRDFWTWMSLAAFVFIILLEVSPSSTAVDRVALYWIPLQLFIWSRVPSAMGRNPKSQFVWTTVVLAYCFMVQFVWLFYAAHSMYWLPYKFFPWEWLWS